MVFYNLAIAGGDANENSRVRRLPAPQLPQLKSIQILKTYTCEDSGDKGDKGEWVENRLKVMKI